MTTTITIIRLRLRYTTVVPRAASLYVVTCATATSLTVKPSRLTFNTDLTGSRTAGAGRTRAYTRAVYVWAYKIYDKDIWYMCAWVLFSKVRRAAHRGKTWRSHSSFRSRCPQVRWIVVSGVCVGVVFVVIVFAFAFRTDQNQIGSTGS
jgi:hypothetical protein